MLKVTLDIRSGLPNPTWYLSPSEERELLDRVMANPRLMKPVNLGLTHLGYRGMIVSLEKEDEGAWSKMRNHTLAKNPQAALPSVFRVFGDSSNSMDNVERWFVDTSDNPNSEVDDFMRNFLAGGFTIPTGQDIEDIVAKQPTEVTNGLITPEGYPLPCTSNHITGTDFSFWNSAYVGDNNCYNFAANHRTNTYAQPGRRAGVDHGLTGINPINTTQFINALKADGWKDYCDPTNNLFALLVFMPYDNGTNPTNDFHWYRQVQASPVSLWGHKPGGTYALMTDSSGYQINWPLSSDRRYRMYNTWYPGYTLTSSSWYFFWDNSYALVN